MPILPFELPPALAGASLIEFCASPHLVPFFRMLLAALASAGIADYRLKVNPTADGRSIAVSVSHGKAKSGPRVFPFCLSCDPDLAAVSECNYEGGEAGRAPPGGLPPHLRALTSSACEWTAATGSPLAGVDESLARVWLDAQARPLQIVTPRRHAGGMADMSDAELAAVWAAVGRVVAHEWPGPRAGAAAAPFSEVVLNVGSFRNIEHAHVKVWFDAPDFLERMLRWPPAKRALQADLHELRRLMKVPDAGTLAAALASAPGGPDGPVELLVRGRFSGAADEAELARRFGAFAGGGGGVLRVDLADPRFAPEGALVVMAGGVAAATAAVQALNLTAMGANVMCKVKLVAALAPERPIYPAGALGGDGAATAAACDASTASACSTAGGLSFDRAGSAAPLAFRTSADGVSALAHMLPSAAEGEGLPATLAATALTAAASGCTILEVQCSGESAEAAVARCGFTRLRAGCLAKRLLASPTPHGADLRSCRSCGLAFDTALNGPTSCVRHPQWYGGETAQRWQAPGNPERTAGSAVSHFWSCCGAHEWDARGCATGWHRTFDEGDE